MQYVDQLLYSKMEYRKLGNLLVKASEVLSNDDTEIIMN